MTASYLIEKADALFPNVYPFPVKADWLFEFDKKLHGEFLSRYGETASPDEKEKRLPEIELLLPEEFSGVYINYIIMLMELYSGNVTGYRNRASLFNSEYLSFMSSYNRTHLIKPVNITV